MGTILDPFELEEIDAGTVNWPTIYNENLARINAAIPCFYRSIPAIPPISAGQTCRIDSSSGYLRIGDCSASGGLPGIGVATNTASTGEQCIVQTFGLLDIDAISLSLTNDSDYYFGRLAQIKLSSDSYVQTAASGFVQYLGRTCRIGGTNYLFINPALFALGVDETDTNAQLTRMVSNNLAKGWEDKVDYRRASQSFAKKNVPATTTADVYIADDSDFPTVVMPYDGAVCAVSARANAAPSAGQCVLTPEINGTPVSNTSCTLDSSNQSAYGTSIITNDTFSAGDRLGMQYASDGSWAPTTLDITVTAWVIFTA